MNDEQRRMNEWYRQRQRKGWRPEGDPPAWKIILVIAAIVVGLGMAGPVCDRASDWVFPPTNDVCMDEDGC